MSSDSVLEHAGEDIGGSDFDEALNIMLFEEDILRSDPIQC